MPDFRHLTRPRPVTATVDLGEGDNLTLTVDANKVTPAWTSGIQQSDDILSVARALSSAIMEWDVSLDEQPFPPTTDNLTLFPLSQARRLLECIVEATVPGEAEGNASQPSTAAPLSATSGPASMSSPNGSDISSSPVPSASASLS